MFLADTLVLDAPRRTADGYLAVRARAARTGVYQYSGREVDPENAHGLRDQASVNVLRDDAEVFAEQSVRSFLMKPITDNHPSESVTAGNWRDHARGVIAGAMRDGDHLAFDLVLMDAAAIDAVNSGKRELSNGYESRLEFGEFKAADGTVCQARQTNIRGNHIALVDRGRAGSSCRIGDIAHCDALPETLFDKEKPVKTMLIDGLTVDISNADTAQATIATILASRDEARGKVAGLETQVATLTTDGATKDAKITTLEQQLADSKPTPAQLRDAAKAYAITAGKAKALGVTVTDAMDEAAIMKAAVTAKLGDKAKDWTDAQFAASFASLTADVKLQESDPLRDAISSQPIVLGDGRTAAATGRAAWLNNKQSAYRGQPTA